MSTVSAIASYVLMQGRTTTDAVARAFPHLPRATVQKAIQNASYRRLIHVEQQGRGGWKSSPAILCAPLPDMKRANPQRVRVASVWELANPQPLQLPDLPAHIYTPLGPWSELEGAAAA